MTTVGTQSMNYNPPSNRVNATTAMNYTNTVIKGVDLKTDAVRVLFTSDNGTTQNVEGATGVSWSNVFVNTVGSGIYPTVATFSPQKSTNWDVSKVNGPIYLGDSKILSIFGHVVLKQSDGIQDSNNVQLSVWTKKAVTPLVPIPVHEMLYEDAGSQGLSSAMAVAIPDISHAINKSTSTMTVNLVIPITKGETIQLRIRNSGGSTVSYTFYQVHLFCKPIELHGADKKV